MARRREDVRLGARRCGDYRSEPRVVRCAVVRRAVLLWSLCLFLSMCGCQRNASTGDEREQKRPVGVGVEGGVRQVPLRIVSAAPPAMAEQIMEAWRLISDQPIEIRSVAAIEVIGQAKQADVLIGDDWQVGDLVASQVVSDLPEVVLNHAAIDRGSLLGGLVGNSMIWGNRVVSLPLTARVPAIFVRENESLEQVDDWQAYQEIVQRIPGRRAAEPLADGWAVHSFLVRAASLTAGGWLFDRQTFEPMIELPPYRRALEQMVAVRSSYPEKRLGPGEIFQRLESGELEFALVWPESQMAASRRTGDRGLRLLPLPRGGEVFIDQWQPAGMAGGGAILVPPSYCVAISSGCRQSGIARSFVTWLVGIEGAPTVRQADGGVSTIRAEDVSEERSGELLSGGTPGAIGIEAAYSKYMVAELNKGSSKPILRIAGAGEYSAALDTAVIEAVEGVCSAEEALRKASAAWREITARRGVKTQLNSWRQAQGMRER